MFLHKILMLITSKLKVTITINIKNNNMINKSLYVVLAIVFLSSCKSKNLNKDATEEHSHNQTTHTHHKLKDYFKAYDLSDENFGTKTNVTVTNKERVMVTNALPNHKTGEFPTKGNPNTISAQSRTYRFPLYPKYMGKAEWVRETGVAINGVKFEPGTAEVVRCESGESYRVEALQNTIDLGLDFNNAHVQPTGAYHYHGSPTSVIKNLDKGEDLVHIGFAHDGFPMYYSKSNAYKPSYKLLDGDRTGEYCNYTNPMESYAIDVSGHHNGTFGSDFEFVSGSGDLDECNGITINGKYMYLVTNEFPYVSRCLMGEFERKERGGRPPNGQGRRN